jgi:DNA-binding PadR family transcriptional regulator
MSSSDPDLTATSYAILGQLALRPWNAYDLTKEMRRNVRYFWPRAESRIYDEVKRLARLGLARAAQSDGRRQRTTYSITARGRGALERWLSLVPEKSYSFESEAVLRVFLANLGSRDALIAALDHAGRDAREVAAVAEGIAGEYLDGRAPFQDLVMHRAIVHDLLSHLALTVAAWAERSRRAVEGWTESDRENERRALDRIGEVLSELEILRTGQPPDPAPRTDRSRRAS